MALSGNLSEVNFKALLELIESTKGTGKLIIKNDSTSLTMHFKNGKPVNAEGDRDPIGTVEKIISLETGPFEFTISEQITESPLAEQIKTTLSKIDEIKAQ